MLTVYDRNRLEVLGDLPAQLVRRLTNSPFVPQTVIVQSRGITHWLSFRLADGLGVCAPVHFPFPATFIRELFQRVLTYVPETSSCLIALDDDTFPRARHSLSFDRMAQDIRRGDRSRRSVVPPSVLVSELLDTITRGFYRAINRRETSGCVWS